MLAFILLFLKLLVFQLDLNICYGSKYHHSTILSYLDLITLLCTYHGCISTFGTFEACVPILYCDAGTICLSDSHCSAIDHSLKYFKYEQIHAGRH